MSMRTRQVHLIQRPNAIATPADFRIVEVTLPELVPGQILVKNLWMSVDPYMRRSMSPDATDLEPWPLNKAIDGPSIGRVAASRNPAFREGDLVESMSGWQEHFVSNGGTFVPYLSPSDSLAKRNAAGAAPEDYVGLLGVAALTAYRGMVSLSRARAGDTVVISSGAGTVGSVACQIGKIQGLRVVTSAGSDEKVRWLKDVARVDYAFNYKTTTFVAAFREACPSGIDLVLESASPEHLCACLPFMNELKQLLIAGFVASYSGDGKVRLVDNFEFVLDRFLTIQSYRFMDSLDVYDAFVSNMIEWRRVGKMTLPIVAYEGLERAPEALCALFTEGHLGKSLVHLADQAY
jgi:NADPH-dependent curcumin reductase CurA